MTPEERRATALRGGLIQGSIFFVLMSWWMLDWGSPLPEILAGLVVWAISGLVTGAIWVWAQERAMRRKLEAGQAADLEPHHSLEITLDSPTQAVFDFLSQHLKASADHTVQECSPDFGVLRARRRQQRGSTLLGQGISITIRAQGGQTAVRIDSQPVLPWVRLDSGHNRQNVQALADVVVDAFAVEPKAPVRDANRQNTASTVLDKERT